MSTFWLIREIGAAQPSWTFSVRRAELQGRTPRLCLLLTLAALMLMVGCSKTATTTSTDSAPAAKGPPSLTASPNPVPAGKDKGTTTITWTTGDGSPGQVYVSDNGKPEILFATAPRGSREVPWIQSGKTYEFRLYAGTEHTQVLARVTVTRNKQ